MTYRIVTAMVKVTDPDVIDKEMVAVSTAVKVDLNRLSTNNDEADIRRYQAALADEAAKIGLASSYKLSPSLIDFKMSTGELEVIDSTINEDLNGAQIFDETQETDVLRSRYVSSLSAEIKAGIIQEVNKSAAAIVALGGTIPKQVSVQLGSEYDDNNYYTEVSEVILSEIGDYRSVDSAIHFLSEYGDLHDLGRYIREDLNSSHGAGDLELSGIGDENFELAILTPSAEEVEEVKKKIYKYTSYGETAFVYDINNEIDITVGSDKELYEKGEIVPYLEHLQAEGAGA